MIDLSHLRRLAGEAVSLDCTCEKCREIRRAAIAALPGVVEALECAVGALNHICEPVQKRECCMTSLAEDDLENHTVAVADDARSRISALIGKGEGNG